MRNALPESLENSSDYTPTTMWNVCPQCGTLTTRRVYGDTCPSCGTATRAATEEDLADWSPGLLRAAAAVRPGRRGGR